LDLRYFGFAYTWLPPKGTPSQSSKAIRTSKRGYLRHPLWGQSYRVIGGPKYLWGYTTGTWLDFIVNSNFNSTTSVSICCWSWSIFNIFVYRVQR
jgi:hypothetical protein